MKNIIGFIIVLLFCLQTNAQGIEGKWKTIDDETNTPKSVVEIYKKSDGKYYGKIVKLFDPKKQNAKCNKCNDEDPRKGQKVIGMEIIKGLKEDGGKYEDGKILDPNNGTDYDCKIWIENNKLKVRGYVLFFYRTQTWESVK